MKKGIYDGTAVYIKTDYNNPKYMFKVVGNSIEKLAGKQDCYRLLDVGGASGGFAYYLKQRFDSLHLTVLEKNRKLVQAGKKNVDGVAFVQGDANNMKEFKSNQFDITTCLGVLGIFDDFRPSVKEMVRVTKKGGTVLIMAEVNECPVDCLIRYRYADSGLNEWRTGLNIFSKKSLSSFFDGIRKVQSYSFKKFVLPFALLKQRDPVRFWTDKLDGKMVFVNAFMYMRFELVTLHI